MLLITNRTLITIEEPFLHLGNFQKIDIRSACAVIINCAIGKDFYPEDRTFYIDFSKTFRDVPLKIRISNRKKCGVSFCAVCKRHDSVYYKYLK